METVETHFVETKDYVYRTKVDLVKNESDEIIKFKVICYDRVVEFDKNKNNQNEDGYRLELNNLIDTYFPPNIRNHLTQYVKISFEKINALTICVITVSRAEEEIFLQLKETDKNKNSLFVKNDARIKKYESVEMVNYIKKHFKS